MSAELGTRVMDAVRNPRATVALVGVMSAMALSGCLGIGEKDESAKVKQDAQCGKVDGFTGMDMDDFGLNEERVLPKTEEDTQGEFITEVSSLAVIMDNDDENKDVYASSLAALYSVIHSSPKDKDGFVDPNGKDLNVSYQEALDTMFPGDEFDKEATVKLCQGVSDYLVENTDEAGAKDINLLVGELKFDPEGDDPEALRIKKLVKAEVDLNNVLVVKDSNGNKVLAYITENDEGEVRVFLPIDPSKGAKNNKAHKGKAKGQRQTGAQGGGGSGRDGGTGGGKGGGEGDGCGGSGCGKGDRGGDNGGGDGCDTNCGGDEKTPGKNPPAQPPEQQQPQPQPEPTPEPQPEPTPENPKGDPPSELPPGAPSIILPIALAGRLRFNNKSFKKQ